MYTMKGSIPRSFIFNCWCVFFWSVHVIQLVPILAGGTVNVLVFFAFLLFFIYQNDYKIPFNITLFGGLVIYGLITGIVLDENVKISILGIEFNYSFYKYIFWIIGIVCSCIFVTCANNDEKRKTKKLVLLVLLLNMISNIIITTYIDPLASKYAGKTGVNTIIGTSDFDAVYSLVILTPIFFYFAFIERNVIGERLKYIVLFFVAIIYVYKSSFFIANLSVLVGICFLILFYKKRNPIAKLLTIFILGVLVFLLFQQDYFFQFLLRISSLIDNQQIQSRIVELVGVLRDGNEPTDAVGRLAIYMDMISGFSKHPIIGCIFTEPLLYTDVAGHTTIFDFLCGYGVIICGFIFFGFYRLIKNISWMIKSERRTVFWSCFGVFIFIALFNPVTNGPMLLSTIIALPYVLLSDCGCEDNE